jgi:hypothetical protein
MEYGNKIFRTVRVIKSEEKRMNNKIKEEFETNLRNSGFSEVTPSGRPSTVYDYSWRVERVVDRENISWLKLAANVDDIIQSYDKGGVEEEYGSSGNGAVINALRRFKEFVKGQQGCSCGGCVCGCPGNFKPISTAPVSPPEPEPSDKSTESRIPSQSDWELEREFTKYLKTMPTKQGRTGYASSTIASYVSAVKKVCRQENTTWYGLFRKISYIVRLYGPGGAKEENYVETHMTTINALEAFERFVHYILRNT